MHIIFFTNLHLAWHPMFTVWHELFSLIFMFPELKTEALSLSTVQGECIYTIIKTKNQEIQFPLLCTKLSIDKQVFVF